jgi:hypothetical protein
MSTAVARIRPGTVCRPERDVDEGVDVGEERRRKAADED